jgi:hypothetical protein
MAIDIKQLLEKKLFNNTDEEKIATLMSQHSYNLKRNNIIFNNGIISFKGVPSPLRLTIMMKKNAIIKTLNEKGLHVRDII